jgi:hypothetical protein
MSASRSDWSTASATHWRTRLTALAATSLRAPSLRIEASDVALQGGTETCACRLHVAPEITDRRACPGRASSVLRCEARCS